MKLDSQERGFLLELAADSRWQSILGKLRREMPVPYAKGDGQESFNDWIFESGRYRENDKLLKLLTGESNV